MHDGGGVGGYANISLLAFWRVHCAIVTVVVVVVVVMLVCCVLWLAQQVVPGMISSMIALMIWILITKHSDKRRHWRISCALGTGVKQVKWMGIGGVVC